MEILILLFSAFGFLDATYLTNHFYTRDPFVCPIFGGCDAVTNSVYSSIAGVPISLFGVLFYATIFLLALISFLSNKKKFLIYASQITLAGFLTSLILVYLQVYVIQAICFYCMMSAISSTILFTLGYLVLRKEKKYLLSPIFDYFRKLKFTEIVWGVLRISLGFVFLWAFISKLPDWMASKSPTFGFLSNGTAGVFADGFQSMAGNSAIDILFMGGMLLVGIALILGISSRLATIGGTLLMILIYIASSLPPKQNPIVDEHIIYIFVLWLIYANKAGQWLGFHKIWAKSNLVKFFPILN